MRLLFLTNLYPPVGGGGFEKWCQEVTDGLRSRGHSVAVLTSQAMLERVQQAESLVFRDLYMEMTFASSFHWLQFFTHRKAHERENLERLRRRIRELEPDLIMIWGMWNLPRSLPSLAEELLPGRVVYFMADYWPTLPSQHELYWQAPAQNWLTRLPKGLLQPFAKKVLEQEGSPSLKFSRAIFPSRFMRDEFERQGVAVKDAQIIYGAVDTRLFAGSNGSKPHPVASEPFSLLYAGRLSPEKGIQTAIQAVDRMVHQHRIENVKLTIVGTGDPHYKNDLAELVQQARLDAYVEFRGPVSKDAMPGLYRQFDAFLFTSTWNEPFGRVLVEALASGTVVIGTATGGAAEILVENENALIFAAGDADSLAGQIIRLIKEPSLRIYLCENGRRIALEKFHITRMIDQIEDYLQVLIK